MKKDMITVYINSTPTEVEKRDYLFQEVIELAFGKYEDNMKSYTMTSTRKNDEDGEHTNTYSFGDKLKMKEGLRIDVEPTNRS